MQLAQIVHGPFFESTVIKFQEYSQEHLTKLKIRAVRPLVLNGADGEGVNAMSDNITERASRLLRTERKSVFCVYWLDIKELCSWMVK